MIGHLSGKVIHKSGEFLILDVNGVGYELTVTTQALGLIKNIGESLSVFVYTDVRENVLQLFGFASFAEKEVFLLLKKAKGVGPKVSQGIVSFFGAEQLLTHLAKNDVTALTKAPGVGKKTAERIVLDLREAVKSYANDLSQDFHSSRLVNSLTISNTVSNYAEPIEDAFLALERLGFSREKADKAISKGLASQGITDTKTIALNAGEVLSLALANL